MDFEKFFMGVLGVCVLVICVALTAASLIGIWRAVW